jgi:hypothetical protein
MGRDIAVAGLVLTADEWLALDGALRAQLLAGAPTGEGEAHGDGRVEPVERLARGTGPVERTDAADAYEAYELVPSPAG